MYPRLIELAARGESRFVNRDALTLILLPCLLPTVTNNPDGDGLSIMVTMKHYTFGMQQKCLSSAQVSISRLLLGLET
jgi:hypothetical protein